MTTGYQIDNQAAMYFLTLTVVEWADVFTRDRYRRIIIESLDYCRKEKGLKIYAYVIMSNHLHLVVSAEDKNLSSVLRDFKRHTANTIVKSIKESQESRKSWLLEIFKAAATKHNRNTEYQFWQHRNHAIELESSKFINQKLAYIHSNPVAAGYVEEADAWLYSSQRNYSGFVPLLEIDLLE